MAPSAHPWKGRRFLRDKDLADRWDVSRNTVWRWTREGRIPAPVKLGPACSRWDQDGIEAFEQQQGAA